MRAERKAPLVEELQHLLRFAERIAEQNRRRAILQRFSDPGVERIQDGLLGWKNVAGMAKGSFDDQRVAVGDLRRLGGEPGSGVEIARVHDPAPLRPAY